MESDHHRYSETTSLLSYFSKSCYQGSLTPWNLERKICLDHGPDTRIRVDEAAQVAVSRLLIHYQVATIPLRIPG